MAIKTDTKEIMDTNWYFSTPVYSIMKPEFLDKAIKATDKFIDAAVKDKQKELNESYYQNNVNPNVGGLDGLRGGTNNNISICIFS